VKAGTLKETLTFNVGIAPIPPSPIWNTANGSWPKAIADLVDAREDENHPDMKRFCLTKWCSKPCVASGFGLPSEIRVQNIGGKLVLEIRILFDCSCSSDCGKCPPNNNEVGGLGA
jgi:hypothetical protein